ncbi:MAG TPA: Tm-1-like ATP-binding domain-containing protein [Pirellulales bacterium]|nr:Tm-1-like ATP-binding domain-containing protein [Pirellulales bacterium]
MSVYLLATLDTKGHEAAFLRDRLRACGAAVTLVDTGALGTPAITPDITREELFLAGGTNLTEIVARADRGAAVAAAAAGAAHLVQAHHTAGRVSGVLTLGGSAGTTIGSAAMRALPLGVPKMIVSTLASGQVRHYVGDKDILMLNAVVDISGLNRVSRTILDEAARAMAGMVSLPPAPADAADRPLVAATMFGVTTPCVERARQVLEAAGCEVLVFHATGSGGQAMESLVADGLLAGVLDITTTELADELVGGFLSAGPDRLTAAGRAGVPQVVSVGATDMVNFHARDTVPERFRDRLLYQHNASVTLMRTTAEENAQIGADIGRKVSAAKGPALVLLPERGVSAIDRTGQPFNDPAARQALFDAIRRTAGATEIVSLDYHVNDPQFAEAAAEHLLALMQLPKSRTHRET